MQFFYRAWADRTINTAGSNFAAPRSTFRFANSVVQLPLQCLSRNACWLPRWKNSPIYCLSSRSNTRSQACRLAARLQHRHGHTDGRQRLLDSVVDQMNGRRCKTLDWSNRSRFMGNRLRVCKLHLIPFIKISSVPLRLETANRRACANATKSVASYNLRQLMF